MRSVSHVHVHRGHVRVKSVPVPARRRARKVHLIAHGTATLITDFSTKRPS
jgi:hypothetical protein